VGRLTGRHRPAMCTVRGGEPAGGPTPPRVEGTDDPARRRPFVPLAPRGRRRYRIFPERTMGEPSTQISAPDRETHPTKSEGFVPPK
jgi:hypothetical protein